MNQVILIGNAGRDAVVKYTQSGLAVCNFSLATSYKQKTGVVHTTWHNITAWGELAEQCKDIATKGARLKVEGSITNRKWTDKNGVERTTTEINARNITQEGQKKQSDTQETDIPLDATFTEQDIPF